jgi:group I intron endonuclease
VKSGIYTITQISTGRVYVGSAVNLAARWQHHRWCLRSGKHGNSRLQRAWNKHGADSFEFFVVEAVEDKALLRQREQVWLDAAFARGNCYNIARFAENPVRGIVRTPEWTAKIVAAQARNPRPKHSAETKAKMSASRMGHRVSIETRAKIAAAKRGKPLPYRRLSEEHRRNLSLAKSGKKTGRRVVLSPAGLERIRAARIAYWKAKKAQQGATA